MKNQCPGQWASVSRHEGTGGVPWGFEGGQVNMAPFPPGRDTSKGGQSPWGRRTCMGTSYTGDQKSPINPEDRRAGSGGGGGEGVKSMYHREKDNDHRSGGNGKREALSGHSTGGVIEIGGCLGVVWKGKEDQNECRAESFRSQHLTSMKSRTLFCLESCLDSTRPTRTHGRSGPGFCPGVLECWSIQDDRQFWPRCCLLSHLRTGHFCLCFASFLFSSAFALPCPFYHFHHRLSPPG